MALRYGGSGVALPLNQFQGNQFSLASCQALLIPPGSWDIMSDGVAYVQQLDPIMGIWYPVGAVPAVNNGTDLWQIDSDGTNFRLVNSTSCPVGAIVTAAGSGYTSAPTVTPSEGTSRWSAIVGGAVSTTVTLVTGGSGYVYPPTVIVAPPPLGGIPAVMRAGAITGGVMAAPTVVAQGAGYTAPPAISFLNDPRDTSGRGASAVAVLTGAGTVTGLLCIDYGSTVVASGTVPTLAFSGGGGTAAAATALMDWVVTSYTVTGAGAGYTGSTALLTVFGNGVPTASAPAYTNPFTQGQLVRTRSGQYEAAVSAGAITATGQQALVYARVAGITSHVGSTIGAAGATTTVATLALVVGGVPSFVYMQTAQA